MEKASLTQQEKKSCAFSHRLVCFLPTVFEFPNLSRFPDFP